MSHNSAQIEQVEAKSAFRWLFGAGTVAVLLVIALYLVDNRLTNSPRERDLGNTLRTLRGAQASLPGRVNDERQTMPFAHQAVESQPQMEVSAQNGEAPSHAEEHTQ